MYYMSDRKTVVVTLTNPPGSVYMGSKYSKEKRNIIKFVQAQNTSGMSMAEFFNWDSLEPKGSPVATKGSAGPLLASKKFKLH